MECRACKETIGDGAKWCPHCHRPQSLIRAAVPPQALIVVVVVTALWWLVSMQMMNESRAMLENSAVYDGGEQLVVKDVSIQISENECGACVATLGAVENGSETPWSDIHFEVTYFDQSGEIVDVLTDDDMDLVIGPGATRRFKVSGKAAADLDSYDRADVVITKASPDRRWN